TKRSTQAGTERVLNLRLDYWEKVKHIEPENLVFVDETGVLLGLTRTHARSQMGTRAYSLNPFYRGSKVTVIGAISIKKFEKAFLIYSVFVLRSEPEIFHTQEFKHELIHHSPD
ncbi:MAG: transposase, partial [Nostoc sp. LLA-1]|nr:transposase [Cyanocohniella sp. LLY]